MLKSFPFQIFMRDDPKLYVIDGIIFCYKKNIKRNLKVGYKKLFKLLQNVSKV